MFREVRAASLEMAQAGADHRVVDEAVGAQLNAADGFEKFGDGHAKAFSHLKTERIRRQFHLKSKAS